MKIKLNKKVINSSSKKNFTNLSPEQQAKEEAWKTTYIPKIIREKLKL